MNHHFSLFRFPLIFTILIVSLGIVACQNNNTNKTNDQIVVTGFIQNLTDTTLTFTYEEYTLLGESKSTKIIIDSSGHFKYKLATLHPLKGFVSFGKAPTVYKFDIRLVNGNDTTMQVESFDFRLVYLYLQPGDSLHMTADVKQIENTLMFTGSGADNNKFVNEEDWEFNAYKQKFLRNYYSLAEMDAEAKRESVNELLIKQHNFLHNSTNNLELSQHLIRLYETSYEYQAIRSLIYYPAGHAGFNDGKYPDLPSDYYAFMDTVKLPDSIDDMGIGAYYFLNSYLRKKYELDGSDKPGYSDFYSYIESQLPERLNCIFKAYALNRDFCKELYDEFGDQCPYQDIASLVKKRYQHLEGMLEGNPFPNFKISDSNGDIISLSDLQGKFVYIDFWATWCGPCVKEIPSLKILESQFKNTPIHFVSISFDSKKDTLIWKNYVKDHKLTGIQLWANKSTHDKISKALNIKSIPRFVLLDQKGRIINANALRPSNPKLKAILQKLISATK